MKKAAALLSVSLCTLGLGLQAAELRMYYDVSNLSSWNPTNQHVRDVQGFGGDLTLTNGAATDGTYGFPVYVASGAGPRNRAYLDMPLYGAIKGSGKGGEIFNQASGPMVGGYTMEGYFYIASTANGFNTKNNTGIGFAQSTSSENQFLRSNNGGGVPQSQTTLGTNFYNSSQFISVDQNINTIVPRDQWFHIVKVEDPVNHQVRWYINGVLKPTATVTLDPSGLAFYYHARGENYGAVGTNAREVKGVRYSMTRFYRGILTDDEIYAAFESVGAPPAGTIVISR